MLLKNLLKKISFFRSVDSDNPATRKIIVMFAVVGIGLLSVLILSTGGRDSSGTEEGMEMVTLCPDGMCCSVGGNDSDKDLRDRELSEAHRILSQDSREVLEDEYADTDGFIDSCLRTAAERSRMYGDTVFVREADESVSLPFFADPREMFGAAGNAYDCFLDATSFHETEEGIRMLVSSILWFFLAVFVLFLWVVLPFFVIFILLHTAVMLWRVLARLWWGDWGSFGFCSDRKLRAAVEMMRRELDMMYGDKSRIPMETFSGQESERLLEKYPDAPVWRVDWVSDEELSGFVEWCCRKAEEIFRNDEDKLRRMLDWIQYGSVWCLRAFDMCIQDADRISVWESVSQPYVRCHEKVRMVSSDGVLSANKPETDDWPDEGAADDGDKKILEDWPDAGVADDAYKGIHDRAGWIARAEAEFADDDFVRSEMILTAEKKDECDLCDYMFEMASKRIRILRKRYPDCVSSRPDIGKFWIWCIRHSASVSEEFGMETVSNIRRGTVRSVKDYDYWYREYMEGVENGRQVSDFFGDEKGMPADVCSVVEAERERSGERENRV